MDSDLLARFEGLRLPRYTSYPTAPHFTAAVDSAVQTAWLAELPHETDLSLYLHVPFCAELCLYCGCQTTVSRRYAPISTYADLIIREIACARAQMAFDGSVTHIHWGGGTPTILRGSDMRRIAGAIARNFHVSRQAEIAVEVDPRTITPAHVETLAAIGVNRVSLGVQSFDPLVQRTVRRMQSFAETRRVTEWLRFYAIEHLNIDLMYGLPYQSVGNVVETVAQALEFDPDRVSLFGYAHVPWMKRHQARLPAAALPDSTERVAQFEAAAVHLIDSGYRRVGLDHFAKPDDPLVAAQRSGRLRRNFQGYTTDRAPALIGFGASAISALPQGYAQNAATVPEYGRWVEAGRLPTVRGVALTAEDRLRRDVIERVMCDFGVDLREICSRHGTDPSWFAAELSRIDTLARQGLVRRHDTRIEVTPEAHDLVRVVGAVFDAHLTALPGQHSSAI